MSETEPFCDFVRETVDDLEGRGHRVEVAGVFYHVGENDMSFFPYRREAARRIGELVTASRDALGLPKLRWYVSQQPPTDHESVNDVDVTAAIAEVAREDKHFIHIPLTDLPEQRERLVLDTRGVVRLGELLAKEYLRKR